jgi:SAM-dependent methyltransferase
MLLESRGVPAHATVSDQVSQDLLQRIRAGELDARRVLLTPEAAAGAADLSIEALLSSDPTLDNLGERDWSRVEAERGARIGDLEADRRAWVAELMSFWRTKPSEVSRVTSPDDGMYAKTPDLYFPVGAVSLRCVRLGMLEARKTSCESILDFACGYGRVTRYLRAAFPDARLAVADNRHDAVDFCAQEFGAIPVYSGEDFTRVELPGQFDVIWVGSLFTHVSEPRWVQLLDLLESALADEGLLVFTVQGRNVREELLAGKPPWTRFDEGARLEIVRGFDETGYGYADWAGAGDYGTSINSPSWVCGQIEQRAGLRLVGYRETGWGRQDVVTCQARRGSS